MQRTTIYAIALSAFAGCAVSTAVHADTIFDVENARAAARSGWHIDDNKAEFLDRWGALSGSEYDPARHRRDKRQFKSHRVWEDRQGEWRHR